MRRCRTVRGSSPARRRRRSAAQVPAPADTSGRDTSRVAQLPEIKVTVTRTPEPLAAGAVRGRRRSTAPSIQRGAADHRARRGAEQHPRRRRRQPLQLLARPADLDPRVRQPVQLRRARHQDPARRHSADAARTGRASSPTWSSPTSSAPRCSAAPAPRSTATPRAAWSRSRPSPRPSARSPSGVQGRRAAAGRRTGDGFYKWQSWTSARSATPAAPSPSEPVQGRRVPPAQRGRDPAAQRGRGLRLLRHHPRHAALQRGRRPQGREPRRPHARRVHGQSRLGGRDQYLPRRRQGRPAAAARAGSQALRRRRERVPGFASSVCCAT